MTITINHFLIASFLLFSIGLLGVLVRRNFLTVLMSVELMLNAVNLNLVAFSRRLSDLTGQVFSVFVITIAAGEAAIGLALANNQDLNVTVNAAEATRFSLFQSQGIYDPLVSATVSRSLQATTRSPSS